MLSSSTLRIAIRLLCFSSSLCLIHGLGAADLVNPRKSRNRNWDLKEFLRYYVDHWQYRVVAGMVCGWLLGNYWGGLVGALLAYLLPIMLAGQMLKRQQARLESQLLDGLGMMQGGLRAGFNLYQVLELVARETEPPLADIARRIASEVQLGVPMDVAWVRAGVEVSNQTFSELVTAVTIQRQMGGDLGLVLGTLREAIRERTNLSTKLKSVTSQGRLTGIVISILPLALAGVIQLIMPKFIEPLFFNPIGQVLLGIAFALEVVGVWMISRICSVDP